ncbi:hypothetical protein [Aeromicrobium sp. REDSEA-S32_B7]|uniref:hypothetical protein n=1 Tax=Aeromicrobium sp. REDSEA-S32_B7 TaxID=1811526 RepID=UPI000B2150D9|nr:hypothetical protein [Aeromicrobium sp. REDSEA-S32_B7]
MHAPDPAYDLWDFDDAPASETRFRAAAQESAPPQREVLLTQVARAVPATQRALARARECHDTRARDWDASLLNNLGMAHVERNDWRAALAAFDAAMTARARIGEDERTRVARWTVGWALRNIGSIDMALDVQQALKEDLDELGLEDPYVDEELALLESLMANIDDLEQPGADGQPRTDGD